MAYRVGPLTMMILILVQLYLQVDQTLNHILLLLVELYR